MLTIFVLVVGILIGLTIDSFLNKKLNECNENIISNLQEINKIQEELIKMQEDHHKVLEQAYNNCQSGINDTINENIELRKRLSKVK